MTAALIEVTPVFAAYLVGHQVGDHWVQTNWQAVNKGRGDRVGVSACARHVLTYVLTQCVTLLLLVPTVGLRVTVIGVVAGLAVSGVTHYVVDRRRPLTVLARLLERRMGKLTFLRLGTPRDVTLELDGRAVSVLDTRTWERVPLDNATLGTGAYALDQSWHILWCYVAAIVTRHGRRLIVKGDRYSNATNLVRGARHVR